MSDDKSLTDSAERSTGSSTESRGLTDWAIHVVEMAHQSSAGGLGTDDLDQSDLIEREAAKVAAETDYRQSRIEERATKIAEKGSGL